MLPMFQMLKDTILLQVLVLCIIPLLHALQIVHVKYWLFCFDGREKGWRALHCLLHSVFLTFVYFSLPLDYHETQSWIMVGRVTYTSSSTAIKNSERHIRKPHFFLGTVKAPRIDSHAAGGAHQLFILRESENRSEHTGPLKFWRFPKNKLYLN